MAILSSSAARTNGKAGCRRLIQLERILQILEILAGRRYAITRQEIRNELSDISEKWCDRTIRRDLDLLEFLGLVCADQTNGETRFAIVKVRSFAKLLQVSVGVA